MGDTWVPLNTVDSSLEGDLLVLIVRELSDEDLKDLGRQAATLALHMDRETTSEFVAPYRRPRKIWGIGLNYSDHAQDLDESTPEQPASFIKGDHTIVGPDDTLRIPRQSKRVTSEAELGLIMGRTAKNVSADDALSYVFGVCPILDQTAEDILALNPRYLTRSKNFETFFSFGPQIVTLDEFLRGRPLADVRIATVLNGKTYRENRVQNMTHAPRDLISFHSQIMPLYPGDIISTGTPGAAHITEGDTVEAEIDGLSTLRNRVKNTE